ncbi:MAG: lipopolysaccharide biosynthesis protein [Nitrospirae bacterium]|nr:lipopolysaccharide biosynthesis protein [Nitrospirota bacterium]
MIERLSLFKDSKSVRARFFTTLIANLIRFVLSFLSGLFIARALGPSGFGNFNFLLMSFASISTLLDMGTSNAFYTFISKRKRASAFYLYYISWTALQFIIAVLLATVLLPEVLRQKIWLGHETGLVLLSLLASFGMNQLWQSVSQAGESIRATIIVQTYNVVLSLVYVLAILLMIKINVLTVSNLFIFIGGLYIFFAVLLSRRLKEGLLAKAVGAESLGSVFKEFKAYCYPLIAYSWMNFAYMFADNWLLQRFGGAEEQGYYSIGYRFTFLSSIATASMLQVFWKETAEAVEKHDYEGIKRLYFRVSRILYFLSALLSCFLIPFSRELLVWLVGPSYEGAWIALSIILLFPLIQAIGQIAHTVLLAGGHTVIYRNIGVTFMAISIPLTYLILAPPQGAYLGIPGLGLASAGMALKIVVLNFIGTNIMVYIISRMNKWRFDFWYQLVAVAILLLCAFGAKTVTGWLLSSLFVTVSIPLLIFNSLLLYLLGVVAVIYLYPTLTGVRRDEFKTMLDNVRGVLTFGRTGR